METSDIILFIVIVILLIIFIIILIWAIFCVSTTVGEQTLNEFCTCTSDCVEGLSCENNICKANIGSTCFKLTDCVNSATACFENICVNTKLSNVGGHPPCKPILVIDKGLCKIPINGDCKQDSDCVHYSSGCHKGTCKKKHNDSSSDHSQSSSCDHDESSSSNHNGSSSNKSSSNESSSNKSLSKYVLPNQSLTILNDINNESQYVSIIDTYNKIKLSNVPTFSLY